MATRHTCERRVLLLTPTGRDAPLIADTLRAFGIESYVCGSIEQLVEAIPEGCAALVMAEEVLTAASLRKLGSALGDQPTWSDLAVIVLTRGGEQEGIASFKLRMLAPLGNVSLVERPVQPSSFVSIIQSALRARDRQYQFREQAQALKRSNEDLQRFAHTASHDLQEPLRMIGSYSQLLARRNEQKLDEDSRQFLRFILNGVERMRALICDLLEYSRYTGTEYPPASPVDCNSVLGQALQHLQFKISERGASINFERLPLVMGHEVRMLQVFQNLIGNALKYCERKPEITITARREGDFWVIGVHDNGIGIAAEHQNRVFGLFQRLHTTEEYPGSGIGLATCKRIIEQYGGRIWVESQEGVGSSFYFSAPAAEGQNWEPADAKAS
jgi:signal transduction histidine kinase